MKLGRIIATASAAAALGLCALGAHAQSALRAEKELAIKRKLSRLCMSEYETSADRSCSATFKNGALVIRQKLDRTGAYIRKQTGNTEVFLETTVAFDPQSYFFCGEPDSSNRAPLYVSCSFDDTIRGPRCVEHVRTELRIGVEPVIERSSSPIALLARADLSACEEVRRSLNALLGSARAGADPYARDPG